MQRMSVGLDVHARSVVAAALDGVTGEVSRARLTSDHGELLGWTLDPRCSSSRTARPAVTNPRISE